MTNPQASESTTPPASGCQYEVHGSAARLALAPELSDVKWDQIEAIAKSLENRLNEDKPKNVVFDISGLTYIGSAMVALVVRWWKTVQSNKGQSVVVVRDPNVLEVLKLASLDEHWTIVPTLEAGYRKLGISAPTASNATGSNNGSHRSVDSASSGETVWPGLVAAIATAGSIAGLACAMAGVIDKSLGSGIGLCCAAAGAIVGLIGAVLCAGKGRTLSILFLVLSLAAGGATFALLGVQLPGGDQTANPNVEIPEAGSADSNSEPAKPSTESAN